MMGVQVLDLPTEERDKLNILFFRAEMAIHKQDRGLAENCMQKHLDWKSAGQIAESVAPGFTRRITGKDKNGKNNGQISEFPDWRMATLLPREVWHCVFPILGLDT